jgi:hypothetical protein
LWQLQFHCGEPPPAADPSTRSFTEGCREEPKESWASSLPAQARELSSFSAERCTS